MRSIKKRKKTRNKRVQKERTLQERESDQMPKYFKEHKY